MSRIALSKGKKFRIQIANLVKYTSAVADHLAIAALHSLIEDDEIELEKLSIPRNLSDRIMSSKYSSQLDQVLDPSFAFNKARVTNARAIVQQVLEISKPTNDESLVGKEGDSGNDKRLLSFLCRLNYGEVSQLEDELRSAYITATSHTVRIQDSSHQAEHRVPGSLQCFEFSYAIKLNQAMKTKDKSTLKEMFASEAPSRDRSSDLVQKLARFSGFRPKRNADAAREIEIRLKRPKLGVEYTGILHEDEEDHGHQAHQEDEANQEDEER